MGRESGAMTASQSQIVDATSRYLRNRSSDFTRENSSLMTQEWRFTQFRMQALVIGLMKL
jgi:hypothetical protein